MNYLKLGKYHLGTYLIKSSLLQFPWFLIIMQVNHTAIYIKNLRVVFRYLLLNARIDQ